MNGVPHEHISNAVSLTSYTFNQNTAAQHTVHTTSSGLLFVVYMAFVHCYNVSNLIVTFESGSTEIFRQFYLAFGGTGTNYFRHTDYRTVTGMPYFVGRAAGDNFNVTLSGALQTNGAFLVGEVPPRGVQ